MSSAFSSWSVPRTATPAFAVWGHRGYPRGRTPCPCRKHSCAATSVVCRGTSDPSAVRSFVLTFAIIAEGPTDQVVLRNILLGYFDPEGAEQATRAFKRRPQLPKEQVAGGMVLRSL